MLRIIMFMFFSNYLFINFYRSTTKFYILLSSVSFLNIGCSRGPVLLNNKGFLEEINEIRAKMGLKESPDTHGHESMEEGEVATHAHACSMCNTVYEHTHLKKPLGSCGYRHLCPGCMEETSLPTCIEPKNP